MGNDGEVEKEGGATGCRGGLKQEKKIEKRRKEREHEGKTWRQLIALVTGDRRHPLEPRVPKYCSLSDGRRTRLGTIHL